MWGSIVRVLIAVVGGWIGSDLADLYSKKKAVPSMNEVKETFGGNLAKYGIIAVTVFVLGFLGFQLFRESKRKK